MAALAKMCTMLTPYYHLACDTQAENKTTAPEHLGAAHVGPEVRQTRPHMPFTYKSRIPNTRIRCQLSFLQPHILDLLARPGVCHDGAWWPCEFFEGGEGDCVKLACVPLGKGTSSDGPGLTFPISLGACSEPHSVPAMPALVHPSSQFRN
jgi:hypothetical protein